jgi:Tfp pilus assembly protein PilO
MMRTLKNQIMWSGRLQWGMSIGLAVAVTVFFFGGYGPAKKRLDSLRVQLESKQRDLEQNQNRARNLPLLQFEVGVLERQVRDYDRQFPRQADPGGFIREITLVVQQLTLKDWKYTPQSPRKGDAYFELPILMSFQGDFMNAAAFLREIEHLQRLTRVRRLAIKYKDAKSGLVEVEIGLNIYFSEG